ncbi:MAG: UDP-3-O-acyl-N-acetylglucosamine deacetylase [Armatimonadetes bacterium]|nr:UDP-3-O-acyl-N-acetylglucosamine deacetylase [Armatimonadota bacterium]
MVFEGVGLHTGEPARVVVHPSDAGALWVQKGQTRIPVRWDYVVDTRRATVLGGEGITLSTVEHLLSACWGLRIGSAVIEVVQGTEVPALDGSALPFLQAFEAAGIVPCPHAPCFVVAQRWIVQQGESVASMMPGTETAFAYIQFPAPLGVQAGVFGLRDYATEIAPARTFGFLHEVEALRQQGLAKGGSLENALLIDQNGYYNSARFADEPLRHKVLDALGDLMLCGACPVGFHLTLIKAGHTLHRELARLLMSECNRMEAHDGGMAPGY